MIGFGGLWKSPYGGHIQHMTKVPWMHLLIPEEVVLRERRRYRPDEDPSCYEEIKGGLNRMTLEKFQRTMDRSGLECDYFEINRNDRPIARALNLLSRAPGLERSYSSQRPQRLAQARRRAATASHGRDDLVTAG